MASRDAIRALAGAREGAFAKIEQEAAVQRRRRRLVGAGLLDDAGESWLVPRRAQTLDESEKSFEILAEILAAETRVDAPEAAAAAERRWKRHGFASGPPPPGFEEQEEAFEAARKARASAVAAGLGGYGASSLVMRAPKLSLRPRAWDDGGGFGGGGGGASSSSSAMMRVSNQSPAVAEAAGRGFATGARAAAYGSGLAVAGVALAALWAARTLDSSSSSRIEGGEEMTTTEQRASFVLRDSLSPIGDAARETLGPIASWARSEIGGGGGGGNKTEEFSSELGKRLEGSKKKWAARAGFSRSAPSSSSENK